jgi:hypothetical protein
LLLSITDYLSASPARIFDAQRQLTQLDSLGKDVIGYRFRARLRLVAAVQSTLNDSLAEEICDTIIAYWRRLPIEERTDWQTAAGTAYRVKAEIAQRTRTIADARRIMDTAKAVIPEGLYWSTEIEPEWRVYTELLGTPAPPIEVQWWFGHTTRAAASRPHRGVVTVVGFGTSSERAQALSRWAQRFGDRIEFLTLEMTRGWMRDTAPVLPKDEAEYRYGEYQRQFQLPGLVGVYETEYDWLKDGRRSNRALPQNLERYGPLQIIDQNGIVRYVTVPMWFQDKMLGWVSEDLIARKIAQLIAEGTP